MWMGDLAVLRIGMKQVIAIALSQALILATACALEASSSLPTEKEVQGLIEKCSMGKTIKGESSGQIDIAKLFYRQMVVEGKFRFDDIGGILGNLSSDQAKLSAYNIYIECIKNNSSTKSDTIIYQNSNSGDNIYQSGGSIEINK